MASTADQEHKLTRDGNIPLAFRGSLVAEAGDKWHGGKERNRWIDLRLYRTRAGAYVVERVLRTMWQGEQDVHEAVVCESAEVVVEAIRGWDPAQLPIGYPPGEQYTERQARLLGELRAIYRARATTVLQALDVSERVE